jgi:hypothetical protein
MSCAAHVRVHFDNDDDRSLLFNVNMSSLLKSLNACDRTFFRVRYLSFSRWISSYSSSFVAYLKQQCETNDNALLHIIVVGATCRRRSFRLVCTNTGDISRRHSCQSRNCDERHTRWSWIGTILEWNVHVEFDRCVRPHAHVRHIIDNTANIRIRSNDVHWLDVEYLSYRTTTRDSLHKTVAASAHRFH